MHFFAGDEWQRGWERVGVLGQQLRAQQIFNTSIMDITECGFKLNALDLVA